MSKSGWFERVIKNTSKWRKFGFNTLCRNVKNQIPVMCVNVFESRMELVENWTILYKKSKFLHFSHIFFFNNGLAFQALKLFGFQRKGKILIQKSNPSVICDLDCVSNFTWLGSERIPPCHHLFPYSPLFPSHCFDFGQELESFWLNTWFRVSVWSSTVMGVTMMV